MTRAQARELRIEHLAQALYIRQQPFSPAECYKAAELFERERALPRWTRRSRRS